VNITKRVLTDSYSDLTQRAKIDLDFLLLTVAAAVICAFGFKLNSASVIGTFAMGFLATIAAAVFGDHVPVGDRRSIKRGVVMLGIGVAEQNADLVLASGIIVLCNVFGIYLGAIVMVAGLNWILRARGAS
jgi:hypothetical protein